jgi:hypothetical protein
MHTVFCPEQKPPCSTERKIAGVFIIYMIPNTIIFSENREVEILFEQYCARETFYHHGETAYRVLYKQREEDATLRPT